MSKKIPIIFDVDTGIDDAVSIMLALKSKKLDVKLIVTCHGNTDIDSITGNTLDVLASLKENIPVAKGLAGALVKDRSHVFAHGADGLGGYEYPNNPLKPLSITALEATHNLLQNVQEPIVYLCVSPVSNLANLLQTYPQDAQKIKEAVIMVGSNQQPADGELPYREFNASVDPEALEIVLNSDIKKTIISMEMGHTAYLSWQDVYKTKITNKWGRILENIYRSYNDYHVKNGIATHDPCAVAYLVDPSMFKVSAAHLKVNYYKEYDTGVGVVDYTHKPNVLITQSINIKKFKKLYFKCLKRCKI